MTSLCKVTKRKNYIISTLRDLFRNKLEELLHPDVADIEAINIILDRIEIEKTVNDRKSRGDDSHEIRVNGERVLVRWNLNIIFESEDDFAKAKISVRLVVIWFQ